MERFAGRPALSKIFGDTRKGVARDEKIYTAHVRYGYTLTEIGDFLGIHYSTVSKALKKVKRGKEVNSDSKIKT